LVPQVPGRSTQVWAGSGLSAGTFVQTPMVPDSAHDLQALAQAVAQQTPCAQFPDAHSARSEQNAPGGFNPQELPTQTLPGAQLASTAQAPKHLLPLQANGTQEMSSGATQVPVALQVDSGVYLLFSQRSGAQTVPVRYRRQPPAPSHFPSVPQVDGAWVGHMLRRSSRPAAIGMQVPSADGSAQDRHGPTHAWSQQTPSTQWLLAQSAAAAHGWPRLFLPQLPFWQAMPATQSLSLVQRLMQAPSAQRYGAQFCMPGGRQLPRPLHVPAVIRRSPLQAGAVQTIWAAKRPHPPRPSHTPVVPQVAGACVAQTPCGSGPPASAGQQVPRRPCWLQLTQGPLQATLQQTPSVQKPDLHSLFAAHTAPPGLSPQLPFAQTTPVAQSALDRHVEAQLFVVGSQL
jgi:hypothetical protein